MTREDALSLMHDFTKSESLRRHMYGVEIAMRAYAAQRGEDEDAWGLVGLIHDFDYEKFPNDAHSATEEHPAHGVRILREKGLPEESCTAILGHATYCNTPRETPMARTLFAVDELCGFLTACALVRPSKSLEDLTVKSVKKKLKDKAFAKGVSREDIQTGLEELDVTLEDHVQFLIQALQPHEANLGLGAGTW